MTKRYRIVAKIPNGEIAYENISLEKHIFGNTVILKIGEYITNQKVVDQLVLKLRSLSGKDSFENFILLYGSIDVVELTEIGVVDQSEDDEIFELRAINKGTSSQQFVMVDTKTGSSLPAVVFNDKDIILRRSSIKIKGQIDELLEGL